MDDEYKAPDSMEEIRFTVSVWHHQQLKEFAEENGMTVRALLRFIINQFTKVKDSGIFFRDKSQ